MIRYDTIRYGPVHRGPYGTVRYGPVHTVSRTTRRRSLAEPHAKTRPDPRILGFLWSLLRSSGERFQKRLLSAQCPPGSQERYEFICTTRSRAGRQGRVFWQPAAGTNKSPKTPWITQSADCDTFVGSAVQKQQHAWCEPERAGWRAQVGLGWSCGVGSGLVVARREDDSWGPPSALAAVTAGWGLQASATSCFPFPGPPPSLTHPALPFSPLQYAQRHPTPRGVAPWILYPCGGERPWGRQGAAEGHWCQTLKGLVVIFAAFASSTSADWHRSTATGASPLPSEHNYPSTSMQGAFLESSAAPGLVTTDGMP